MIELNRWPEQAFEFIIQDDAALRNLIFALADRPTPHLVNRGIGPSSQRLTNPGNDAAHAF